MTKTSLTRFVPMRISRYGTTDLCPIEGDTPVLQFLNTHRYRGTARAKNYLNNYDDFITWCYEVGLVDQDGYNILDAESNCYVHEAESIVNRVIMAREMLYELICCIQNDEPVHPITIGDFNSFNDEANKHLGFAMTAYGFRAVWRDTDEEMAFPLWKIIKYAGEFLASGDVGLIKKCHCGNLYLDKTKNKTRRYCNPLTCGSASRSRQYYLKKVNG
jgi:predicted RNA-binding Zn ribbon-like protein